MLNEELLWPKFCKCTSMDDEVTKMVWLLLLSSSATCLLVMFFLEDCSSVVEEDQVEGGCMCRLREYSTYWVPTFLLILPISKIIEWVNVGL